MFQQLPRLELLDVKRVKPVIDTEEHSKFITGIEMLLYLTKHSRPEICNADSEHTQLGIGLLMDTTRC